MTGVVAPPIPEPVISHKSQMNDDLITHDSKIRKWTMSMVPSRIFSHLPSRICLGRRPTSKSDARWVFRTSKHEGTILVIDLQTCKKVDISKKWCSYWRRDPELRAGGARARVAAGCQDSKAVLPASLIINLN